MSSIQIASIGLERFEYSQIHMGVRVNISCYAASGETAERAAEAAFKRFAELEQIMSDYRPTSELSMLSVNAVGKKVGVSKELAEVFELALELSSETDGAFDITCGPVVALWREARKSGKLPSVDARRDALSRTGYRLVEFDAKRREILLKKPGMKLDLGGIAKGYACDEAIRVMANSGVRRAMVEAGGDIVAGASPPGQMGWSIKVDGLESPYLLANGAISTSGSTEQFVMIGGKRFSHIVDPRTGIGLTTRTQATVAAPKGVLSDALATACCLAPLGADALCQEYGARALAVVSR